MSNNKPSVFITGGAGSLGRVFINRLISNHNITVVDNSEALTGDLKRLHPEIEIILGDFSEHPLNRRYDYYVHLAAYKHVDLGETDPRSFIDNNINNTTKFYDNIPNPAMVLYVSTDKAVEPISIYGMTKAIAERLTLSRGWTVARLGNLYGSSGSVVPIWREAIQNGRPLKITDKSMTRIFIRDIPATVDSIWASFVNGERMIFPPMNAPEKLMDIMNELLAEQGYNGIENYPGGLEVIGLRPGERLHEKIKWDHE